MWIKEGWRWMLNRALGFRCHKPKWFHLPVMRRIAISTPNVMAALRHLRRDQARPYNFALSPVLVNLTANQVTLLAPFEKDTVVAPQPPLAARKPITRPLERCATLCTLGRAPWSRVMTCDRGSANGA